MLTASDAEALLRAADRKRRVNYKRFTCRLTIRGKWTSERGHVEHEHDDVVCFVVFASSADEALEIAKREMRA